MSGDFSTEDRLVRVTKPKFFFNDDSSRYFDRSKSSDSGDSRPDSSDNGNYFDGNYYYMNKTGRCRGVIDPHIPDHVLGIGPNDYKYKDTDFYKNLTEGERVVCDARISLLAQVRSGDYVFCRFYNQTLDGSPFTSPSLLVDYSDFNQI